MSSPKRRRRAPQRRKPPKGKKLAPSRFARILGTATVKMTTDELMRMTRGDDWNKPD